MTTNTKVRIKLKKGQNYMYIVIGAGAHLWDFPEEETAGQEMVLYSSLVVSLLLVCLNILCARREIGIPTL